MGGKKIPNVSSRGFAGGQVHMGRWHWAQGPRSPGPESPQAPWAGWALCPARHCSLPCGLPAAFLCTEPELNLAAEDFIPAGRAGQVGRTHTALFVGSLDSLPGWRDRASPVLSLSPCASRGSYEHRSSLCCVCDYVCPRLGLGGPRGWGPLSGQRAGFAALNRGLLLTPWVSASLPPLGWLPGRCLSRRALVWQIPGWG